MPCVTPLRLALALSGCPEAEQPALAAEAERVRLDFVTVSPAAVPAVQAAAPRLGTLTGDGDRTLTQPGEGDVVAMTVRTPADVAAAAAAADVVLIAPTDPSSTPDLVDDVRTAHAASPRSRNRLLVFADLRLRAGDEPGTDGSQLPATVTGPPSALGRALQSWQRAGLDGFRLVAESRADVELLTRGVVPALLENDAFRRGYESRTLRGVLGLPAPAGARGAA